MQAILRIAPVVYLVGLLLFGPIDARAQIATTEHVAPSAMVSDSGLNFISPSVSETQFGKTGVRVGIYYAGRDKSEITIDKISVSYSGRETCFAPKNLKEIYPGSMQLRFRPMKAGNVNDWYISVGAVAQLTNRETGGMVTFKIYINESDKLIEIIDGDSSIYIDAIRCR